MKEEHSSGGREFLLVIVWAAMLYIVCAALMSAFGDYAFIGGIIALFIFCIFGYFVLTHYSSRFIYVLKDGRLRITRTIGKRNREIDFECKNIMRMQFGEKSTDFARPHESMRVSVINSKKSLYIEYKDNIGALRTVVIEPTEKLRRRIDRERKKIDG